MQLMKWTDVLHAIKIRGFNDQQADDRESDVSLVCSWVCVYLCLVNRPPSLSW